MKDERLLEETLRLLRENQDIDVEEEFKDTVLKDIDGNLIPVYHGTNAKFTEFAGQDCYYFTTDLDYEYITDTDRTIRAYINITNPYYAKRLEAETAKYVKDWYRDDNGEYITKAGEGGEYLIDLLKQDGYDGIIFRGGADENYPNILDNSPQYIVFDENQIYIINDEI